MIVKPQPPAVAQRFTPALTGPLRRRVRALPLVGRVAAYLKRLICLPWNFQKLYNESASWQEVARQENSTLAEGFRSLHVMPREVKRLTEQLAQYNGRFGQLPELLHTNAARLQGVEEGLQSVAAEMRDQHGRIDRLTEAHHNTIAWIMLFQRKFEMLAMDVRERIPSIPDTGRIVEPRIVHSEAYQKRLAALAGNLRINVGCGEKPLPGYINVDFREVPEVDIVAEARHLPFAPGSLAEIASAHLVEHFREHHLRTVLLPYWKSLLQPGGVVRIVCPDWAGMLKHLHDGSMPYADFKLVTFGAQDYLGDDHFAMYTPDSLTELLRDVGFTRIDVVADDRPNGKCREMELIASVPLKSN